MDEQIQLRQAISMILAFEGNLPNSLHISKSHVDLYHDNIDKAETVLGHDLTHFRIPDSDMRQETVSRSNSRRIVYGISQGTSFTNIPTGKYYCPRSLFLIRLQGLVNFLKMATAPQARVAIGFA